LCVTAINSSRLFTKPEAAKAKLPSLLYFEFGNLTEGKISGTLTIHTYILGGKNQKNLEEDNLRDFFEDVQEI